MTIRLCFDFNKIARGRAPCMCSGTSNYKYNIKYSSVLTQSPAIICNLLFQIFDGQYFLKSVIYRIFSKRNYIRFLDSIYLYILKKCITMCVRIIFINSFSFVLPHNSASTTCVLTCAYTVRLYVAFSSVRPNKIAFSMFHREY